MIRHLVGVVALALLLWALRQEDEPSDLFDVREAKKLGFLCSHFCDRVSKPSFPFSPPKSWSPTNPIWAPNNIWSAIRFRPFSPRCRRRFRPFSAKKATLTSWEVRVRNGSLETNFPMSRKCFSSTDLKRDSSKPVLVVLHGVGGALAGHQLHFLYHFVLSKGVAVVLVTTLGNRFLNPSNKTHFL